MISKQKLFVKNRGTANCYNILGLDSPNKHLNDITLRECIMHLRSCEYPEQGLFIATKEMKYGTATMFAFHKKCEREVEEVVAALPILLKVEF